MISVGGKASYGKAMSRLSQMAGAIKDLKPVLAGPINDSLSDLFIEQFDSEGMYAPGGAWAPLTEASEASKRGGRGRGRGGILRDTNALWASFTKGRGPQAISIATNHSLERGTTVPYAEFHQVGTQTMPERQIIPDPMPEHYVEQWEKMVARYVVTGGGV